MKPLDVFYMVKPLIPRALQIHLRRKIARKKLTSCRDRWPIDREAAKPPKGWYGWPEQRQFALVLNHDVDTARGHDRSVVLMEIEKELGFRSAFFFVPEAYRVSPETRQRLEDSGFEVGVHGLFHDGKLFKSRSIFDTRAPRINSYIKEWGACGYSSPSMHRKLEWIDVLDMEYDISTFDTDPFEPQPQGVRTIFPIWIKKGPHKRGFVELPYTLPQDHCLYVILQENSMRIWKEKLDWIAENGGMVLLNTHPDYMRLDGGKCGLEEYPVGLYTDFLEYVKSRYADQYWHCLGREMARFWKKAMGSDTAASEGEAL